MEAEESGEVVAQEELIITTGPIGKEEARWTEMSTTGGEVATMAWEVDGGAVVVETTEVDFGCSVSISSPSWSRSSWMIGISVTLRDFLCFLEGSPSEAFLAYTFGLDCCSSISFLFLDWVSRGDFEVSPIEAVASPPTVPLGLLLSPS